MRRKEESLGEVLFFMAFIPLLICAFYDGTTFKAFLDLSMLYRIVRILSMLLILIKIVFVDQYSYRSRIVLFVILCVMAVSTLASRNATMVEYMMLFLGTKRIDREKILKAFLVVTVPLLVITFVCAALGLIEDYIVVRSASGIVRHSFGIIYPTDFAAHILFILITYFGVKKKLRFYDVIACIGIIAFVDYFCNARISEALMLFSLFLFLILQFIPKLFETPLWNIILCASAPLFSSSVVAFALIFRSKNKIMSAIDEGIFNGRFFIAKKVIRKYGISLFGKAIEMQGDGYKTYTFDSDLGTTYIDSSYLQMLLLFGVIFFVMIIIMITFIAYRSIDDGNLKLQLCIFILLISCIYNQYLFSVAYNPITIVMGTYLFVDRKSKFGFRTDYLYE